VKSARSFEGEKIKVTLRERRGERGGRAEPDSGGGTQAARDDLERNPSEERDGSGIAVLTEKIREQKERKVSSSSKQGGKGRGRNLKSHISGNARL